MIIFRQTLSSQVCTFAWIIFLVALGGLASTRTVIAQQAPQTSVATMAQDFRDLRITELMFDPIKGENFSASDYEFVELWNRGATAIDMGGVSFTDGISLTLPSGLQIGADSYLVIAKEPAAFQERYGQPPANASGYDGQLNNGGETIALQDASENEILALTYDPDADHLRLANGGGFSIVPVNGAITPLIPLDWRISQEQFGSPGRADSELGQSTVGPIKVNEVLAHTDLPDVDFIELYNPTAEIADIGGWYITDDLSEPERFQIPLGTEIAPYGFVSFSETDLGFAFFAEGDSAYLLGADNAGVLSGYTHGFEFGVTPNAVSLSRCTVADGSGGLEERFTLQKSISRDAPNDKPLVGPIVISEIFYAPTSGGLTADAEFIELTNISSAAVRLYDPVNPENMWRINGIGTFTFTARTEIAAGGTLIVTAAEPDQFRQRHNIPATVGIQGPFDGQLQDDGERVSLRQPDDPNLDGTVPYFEVDVVDYTSAVPWPNLAETGYSLERISTAEFGDSWENWRASRVIGGSPGAVDLISVADPDPSNSQITAADSVFLPFVAKQPMPFDDSCFQELHLP